MINNEHDIEKMLKDIKIETDFIKDYGNGILLNNKHIDILNRYDIDYKKFNSLNSLLFEIENILNDDYTSETDDLEWVSIDLTERNYYQNTKK